MQDAEGSGTLSAAEFLAGISRLPPPLKNEIDGYQRPEYLGPAPPGWSQERAFEYERQRQEQFAREDEVDRIKEEAKRQRRPPGDDVDDATLYWTLKHLREIVR